MFLAPLNYDRFFKKIFSAFQKNIVKNKKMKPYVKWFEFAQKTRNENNQKSDSVSYTHLTLPTTPYV